MKSLIAGSSDFKVLLVGPYSAPSGGVQVHLRLLKKYLEQHGGNCFVINMNKNKELNGHDVISPTNSLQVALSMVKKRDHVCHIHFGGSLHMRLCFLAIFSNLLFQKRCVISLHSGGLPDEDLSKNYIKKWLYKLSFNPAGAVICVNSAIRDFLIQNGVRGDHLHTISPFAFDNETEDIRIPQPMDSFMKEKRPLLCNIGLLEPEYDLEMLLRVFRRYLEKKPNAGLLLIGSGSLHRKLLKMISELRLEGKAYLAGDCAHSVTIKALSGSSCYIRASRYDGDCVSLREAIHMGIPAIATDTGMRPKEAILFPIGDEDALFGRLIKIPLVGGKSLKRAHAESSSLESIKKLLEHLN